MRKTKTQKYNEIHTKKMHDGKTATTETNCISCKQMAIWAFAIKHVKGMSQQKKNYIELMEWRNKNECERECLCAH